MDGSQQQMAHFVRRFIYGISHDLGAPIRHMSQFSSLLKQGLEPHISEKEATYFEYIEQAQQQAHQMLDGLRLLSQLVNQVSPDQLLNLAELGQEILQRHQAVHQLDDQQCTFTVQGQPAVHGAESHWRYIFNALIDNAVQHHPDVRQLLLNITLTTEQDTVTLVVEDNGSGIKDSAIDLALTPFRSLSVTKEKYAGMGLTNVSFISIYYKGTLDFESPADGGLKVTYQQPVLEKGE